jgi:hypothetical protein
MPNPRIEQLFLVPGKTAAEVAQWGAAVAEFAAQFPGVYISPDWAEASKDQYERITLVNPDSWPEELWLAIKQNPRPIVVEQIIAPTPDVLAETLHTRTESNMRFGLESQFDWSPQWPYEVGLIGLHGRGDGEMQGADLDVVRRARLEGVKLTSHASGSSVKAIKAINPNMFILVRPIMSFDDGGRARNISPEDFVRGTVNDMQRLFDADPTINYVEVHNEPNLTIEGLGGAWHNGREFATWFDRVVQLYKERWPFKKYGFPGLSPGALNNQRLIDYKQFLADAALSAARADWVAVHGYWASELEMTDSNGGFTWRTVRQFFPDKLLIITEFGNPTESKPVVAEQYARYYGMLRRVPGLGGAFAYISSISDRRESARWAWRDEDGEDMGIADVIGLRQYIQ